MGVSQKLESKCFEQNININFLCKVNNNDRLEICNNLRMRFSYHLAPSNLSCDSWNVKHPSHSNVTYFILSKG